MEFLDKESPVIESRTLSIQKELEDFHLDFSNQKRNSYFISNIKDILREAKSLGFVISTILQHYYDIIILELTKSKETNLGLIALAEEYIKDKGKVIINGENQIGVKSFLKNIFF